MQAANTLTLIGERDVNVNANLTYSGSGTAAVNVQAARDIHVGAKVASLAVNETGRNEKRGEMAWNMTGA